MGWVVWGKVTESSVKLPTSNVVLVRFQGRPNAERTCDRHAPHYFEAHQWGECIGITSHSSVRFYSDDPTTRSAHMRAYKAPDCDEARTDLSAMYNRIDFISHGPRFHVYALPCMKWDVDTIT